MFKVGDLAETLEGYKVKIVHIGAITTPSKQTRLTVEFQETYDDIKKGATLQCHPGHLKAKNASHNSN